MTPGQGPDAGQSRLGRAEHLDLDDVAVGHSRLELRRCALGDELATGDHRDPVAQLVGLEHVVRGEQHGRPELDERRDGLPELSGADRVDADARLVQEQHLRLVDQATGDVQPLPHPTRVALDALPLATGQTHELEELPIRAFCSRGGTAYSSAK